MDFTREPIIETVVTPKEGCKLVVRSSKSTGQEEYFVDAVEVVVFGNSVFFRSLERPKSFLVPASDYEVLEVRETRMVLKNVAPDRSIKIAGGARAKRETAPEKTESVKITSDDAAESVETEQAKPTTEAKDARFDKKRDRRRSYRRRRGREEVPVQAEENREASGEISEERKVDLPPPGAIKEGESASQVATPSILTSLLPPPPNLISETIARYKDNALFRGAFFLKDDQKEAEDATQLPEFPEEITEEADLPLVSLDQPQYGSYEISEDEEEDIYQIRKEKRKKIEESLNGEDSSSTQPEDDFVEEAEHNRNKSTTENSQD